MKEKIFFIILLVSLRKNSAETNLMVSKGRGEVRSGELGNHLSPSTNIEKFWKNFQDTFTFIFLSIRGRKFESKQRKLEEPLKVYNLLSLHKQNNRINSEVRKVQTGDVWTHWQWQ